MKTNQIFVQKLSDNALKINNHIYNLLTMSEEELMQLASKVDEMRIQQLAKISTAEIILANTTAKKPVMQEATSELEFKFKKKFFEKEMVEYGEKMHVASTNLANARKKKEILQDMTICIGFAYMNSEPTVWMVNVATDERVYCSASRAKELQEMVATESENWVYASEYDCVYEES
jgi:hypothetical protein